MPSFLFRNLYRDRFRFRSRCRWREGWRGHRPSSDFPRVPDRLSGESQSARPSSSAINCSRQSGLRPSSTSQPQSLFGSEAMTCACSSQSCSNSRSAGVAERNLITSMSCSLTHQLEPNELDASPPQDALLSSSTLPLPITIRSSKLVSYIWMSSLSMVSWIRRQAMRNQSKNQSRPAICTAVMRRISVSGTVALPYPAQSTS